MSVMGKNKRTTAVTFEQLKLASDNGLLPPTSPTLIGRNSALLTQLDSARQHEIDSLKNLLPHLNPDTKRGTGQIDLENRDAPNWLGLIWAMASLGDGAKEIAREWSKKSARYEETEFENAWLSYDPNIKSPITIASLYKLAGNIRKSSPQLAYPKNKDRPNESMPVNQPRYIFKTPMELMRQPPTQWRVKGLLPVTGLACVFGPSGAGKSFYIIDLLASIVLGENYYNRKTMSCPVTYVVLEGTGGVPNRLKAYEKHHGVCLPDSFRIVTQSLSLLNNDCVLLANELIANGLDQGVIVIDTLAQASPGADENSSTDMGLIISKAQYIQQKTSSLVLLVHHTGKDASRGARGHSSLFASLDAAIELKRTQAGREWLLAKSKDSEDGISHPFRLEQIHLGVDEDGSAITSCVIANDISALFAKPKLTGKNQKLLWDAITRDHKAGDKLTSDALQILAAGAVEETRNKKQRIKEAIKTLIDNGYMKLNGPGDYLIN